MTESAQAGMPWSEIAESAYRAFCHNMRGTHGDAVCLVDWDELPTQTQNAWQAAVRQAECCDGALGSKAPDESRWATWVPPSVEPPTGAA